MATKLIELQSLIDENKDSFNDNLYLQLQTLLKSAYEQKEKEDKLGLFKVEYLMPVSNVTLRYNQSESLDDGAICLINGYTDLLRKTTILNVRGDNLHEGATIPYRVIENYSIVSTFQGGNIHIYNGEDTDDSVGFDLKTRVVYILKVTPL